MAVVMTSYCSSCYVSGAQHLGCTNPNQCILWESIYCKISTLLMLSLSDFKLQASHTAMLSKEYLTCCWKHGIINQLIRVVSRESGHIPIVGTVLLIVSILMIQYLYYGGGPLVIQCLHCGGGPLMIQCLCCGGGLLIIQCLHCDGGGP